MTSPTTTEIALPTQETVTVQHVTSHPVADKTAGQTPSIARRICTRCSNLRWELAPAAANLTLTGLAWAEHLHGIGDGTGLVYGIGLLAAGGTAAHGLKEKHHTAATVGAIASAALLEIGVNAAAGISPAGLITTALATLGSYAIYLPWLHRTGRLHHAGSKTTASPATTASASPALAAPTGSPAAAAPIVSLPLAAAPAGSSAPAAATTASPLAVGSPRAEEVALYQGLAALGVAPLAIDGFTADANGWAALVTLPPGKATSPTTVKAQREQLANNMGLSGRLRLSLGPNSNQLLVKVDFNDVLAEAIPWPGPSITSVKQLMSLGLFEDSEPILLDLMKDHILIGGATDAGKSGIENVILGNLAACNDAEVFGVDMKPGALELGPWDSTMRMLADNADDAAEVFATVRKEMVRRGQHLATLRGPEGERVRKWVAGNPDAPQGSEEWGHGPFWYLVVDELAELLRQAPELVGELLTLNQVARAMGIRIIAATQSPSEKAFGGKGTDARQQYGTRIGLGVNEWLTVNLILGPGAYGAGWALDDLDKPGKLMISNSMHQKPREGRGYWVSDSQIVTTDRMHAKSKTDPNPPTGGGRPHLRSVPTYPDGTRIPDNRVALWQAIDQRGATGATIADLLGDALPGLNARTAISDPIQTWKARGWVVEIGATPDRAKLFALARHTKAA